MGSLENSSVSGRSHPKIPVVDLTSFTSSCTSREAKLATAKDLVSACKKFGFVYVKGHGVPKESLDNVFAWSKKFFDLPLEEKMKAPHPEGYSIYRGYSWPGLEKVSNALSENDDLDAVTKLREVQDFKESYDIGSDENAEEPNVCLPEESLPGLRAFLTSFYWDCWKVAETILIALATGLEIDKELLLSPHNGHHNQCRLLHYPPIPASHLEGGKFARMPTHTDWSTITLLFQDDCGGLQVESPSEPGQFIDADPVEGAVLLNIGDLLMRWTNDCLKSTQHRVQLPPLSDRYTGAERITRERYSIPYFVSCKPDVLIECLKLGDRPLKYEPMTRREYADMRARMQY